MVTSTKSKESPAPTAPRKRSPRPTPAIQAAATPKRPPRVPVLGAPTRELEEKIAAQEKTIEDLRYVVGLMRHLLDGGEFALAQAVARSAAQGKLPSRS